MKRLYTALLLLLVTATSATVGDLYILSNMKNMQEKLSAFSEEPLFYTTIDDKTLSAYEKNVQELITSWDKTAPFCQLLMSAEDCRCITEGLHRAEKRLHSDRKTEFPFEIDDIRDTVENIIHRESLNTDTVL